MHSAMRLTLIIDTARTTHQHAEHGAIGSPTGQDRGEFAHQKFEDPDFQALDWRTTSPRRLLSFIQTPRPNAVFVYGMEARLPVSIAVGTLPRRIPFLYAADSNIVETAQGGIGIVKRLLGYRALAMRVDAALSLGLSNELALRVYGMRNIEPLPVYAVDFAALDRATAEGFGERADEAGRIRVAIVARFVAAKNLVATFRAVAMAPDVCSRIRFVLAGDGPLRPAIEEVIAANPALSVQLLGGIPHGRVGGVISNADALLLPSEREPWGIVVTEALGLGVPVVATPAVGAAVSLAGATQAVVLSEGTDGPAIAAALRHFVARHAELKQAATCAAPWVRETYGLPAVAGRLVEFVRRISEAAPQVSSPQASS